MIMLQRMTKPCFLLLALSLVLSLLPVTAFAAENTYHWAQDSITKAVMLGWFIDGSNTRPDAAITRAEFVTMVNRMKGYSGTTDISAFSDVKADDWYYGAFSAAIAAGYIQGADGKLTPNIPITRNEAVTIFARICELDTSADLTDVFANVRDAVSIPAWAKPYVGAAVKAGLAAGSNGSFNGSASITRAETAVLLERLHENIRTYGFHGTYTGDANRVMITASGVTLENANISGDLTISKSVGNGEVTLKNVKVGGKLDVQGGGRNSVYLENCEIESILITKDEVRVVFLDGTTASYANVSGNNSAIIIASDVTVGSLTVEGADSRITLASGAAVTALTVSSTATNTTVAAESGSKIDTVTIAASGTEITGDGSITTANIKAADVVIEQKPASTVVDNGLKAEIGGAAVTGGTSSGIPSGSSSGNTGSESGGSNTALMPTPAPTPTPTPTPAPPSNGETDFEWTGLERTFTIDSVADAALTAKKVDDNTIQIAGEKYDMPAGTLKSLFDNLEDTDTFTVDTDGKVKAVIKTATNKKTITITASDCAADLEVTGNTTNDFVITGYAANQGTNLVVKGGRVDLTDTYLTGTITATTAHSTITVAAARSLTANTAGVTVISAGTATGDITIGSADSASVTISGVTITGAGNKIAQTDENTVLVTGIGATAVHVLTTNSNTGITIADGSVITLEGAAMSGNGSGIVKYSAANSLSFTAAGITVVSAGALTTNGTVTLAPSGANSFTGALTIGGGTVTLSKSLTMSHTLTINSGAALTLDALANAVTLTPDNAAASLVIGGTLNAVNTGTNAATIVFGNAATCIDAKFYAYWGADADVSAVNTAYTWTTDAAGANGAGWLAPSVVLSEGSHGAAGNAQIILGNNKAYVVYDGSIWYRAEDNAGDLKLTEAVSFDAAVIAASSVTNTVLNGLTNGNTYTVYEVVTTVGTGLTHNTIVNIRALTDSATQEISTSTAGVKVIISTGVMNADAIPAENIAAQTFGSTTAPQLRYTFGSTSANGSTVTAEQGETYVTIIAGGTGFTTTVTVSQVIGAYSGWDTAEYTIGIAEADQTHIVEPVSADKIKIGNGNTVITYSMPTLTLGAVIAALQSGDRFILYSNKNVKSIEITGDNTVTFGYNIFFDTYLTIIHNSTQKLTIEFIGAPAPLIIAGGSSGDIQIGTIDNDLILNNTGTGTITIGSAGSLTVENLRNGTLILNPNQDAFIKADTAISSTDNKTGILTLGDGVTLTLDSIQFCGSDGTVQKTDEYTYYVSAGITAVNVNTASGLTLYTQYDITIDISGLSAGNSITVDGWGQVTFTGYGDTFTADASGSVTITLSDQSS